MAERGSFTAGPWNDRDFALTWTANDRQDGLLALPRAMAAAIVAADRPDCRVILDVASGPGSFLASFLKEFPEATGFWSDASATMLATARERLDTFGRRVEFRLVDMTDLRGAELPHDVDVIATSRASHHLDHDGLAAFYRDAAARLAPGGWLVNLDHIGVEPMWDQRLRASRHRFVPVRGDRTHHHHTHPLAGVADHLQALAAAGLTDVDVPWRAFYTCLIVARANAPTP